MAYFSKNDSQTLKDLFSSNEEKKILKFSKDYSGKDVEHYNAYKTTKTWKQFQANGGKFNDIVKCFKLNNLEINFKNIDSKDDGDNVKNIIQNSKASYEQALNDKAIKADRLKAENAINKALIAEDKKMAKAAIKESYKILAKCEKECKTNKRKHSQIMKKVHKEVIQILNVKAKKLKKEQQEAKKAEKEAKKADKEAKKAEKEAKKAEKEAKKADKEAKKADKEAVQDSDNNDSDSADAQQDQEVVEMELEDHDAQESKSDNDEDSGDDEDFEMTIKKMKLPQLKEELKKKGCKNIKGNKSELQARLLACN
tara:strand:+ start:1869 stop:2804 length:936 start_codon:yes stop_codon:yes gene_type:complete